jgi:hypothetical protein
MRLRVQSHFNWSLQRNAFINFGIRLWWMVSFKLRRLKPPPTPLRERPFCTNWMGDWVGPELIWSFCSRKKCPGPAGNTAGEKHRFSLCNESRTKVKWTMKFHLTLQRSVVTIRTTSLPLTNPTFCPHSAFLYFAWISEQTAIISPYSINWLVVISETECVYCAVRTGYLYIIQCSAHTVYLCILCGSQNKQRLFPYTALTDWLL